MMKKLMLLGMLSIMAFSQAFAVADTLKLTPKPVYGKEASVIAFILDNNHYRKIKLNDSLSSAILDAFIKNLDNNKTYFTQKDVAAFEPYRFTIDDRTRQEDVTVAYEVYAVFRKRFNEQMVYVLNHLVNQEFDYTIDEFYESDRDKEPWCKDEAELKEVWRKLIKSQALSLKLTGKEQPEIQKMLTERYERFRKSISQFNAEDVFSLYMNSITEAYDPHTNYFSPKAADLFKQNMSLSLEGIGARLQTENDYTKVAEVIPGGPAHKSGLIKANDRIIGVAQGDGELVDVIGWRIDEVVKLIKGPKGTRVRLQLLPAETGLSGAPTIIELVRDKIKLEDQQAKKSTIHYLKDGKQLKMGVITLPSFYMDFDEYQKGNPNYTSTTRDVKRLVEELQAEKIDGLVLDLRDNGGGSLSEAIDLTGLFIKEGPVVQVKNSANKIDVGADDNSAVVYSGPLVVMTNRFSASASEIFAGAIQDYHRGVVVGESTFGKGTVQTVVDLNRFIPDVKANDVGELKLTFQKFYRVTGSSTQNKGVTPDVKFPTALDPEQFGESANPSALPWDEIRGTLYHKSTNINDKVLANLNKNYQTRLKSDKKLGQLVNDVKETRIEFQETRVSLQESKRKLEMEEAEKRKSKESNLNTKISNAEGLPESDLIELEDTYLREGLFVLGDLITTKIG